jgi:hypothetical protein
MSASKDFADVRRMLDDCAPGYTYRETDHFYRIKYGSVFYPSLPKKKKIEVGHIHKMVRHLHIETCAEEHDMF